MFLPKMTDKKKRILLGLYRTSWTTSMITVTVVAVLEIFMLVYSVLNAPMYGQYLWKYRFFYIVLLSLAFFYLFLNMFIRKDFERRFPILNYMNPIYSVLFFVWALGITWSDVMITDVADPVVFMTFSLMIPLSFFLLPSVYTVIVTAADAGMLFIILSHSGYIGVLINFSIFVIFQFVLGISFLRLKLRLCDRILEEQRNAGIDVLTGFPNRRSYVEDMKKFTTKPPQDELIYIAVDMNELKEVNDTYGHDAGDRLITGAAQCIERCFGNGKMYRIGGDEFVILLFAKQEDMAKLFEEYESCMKEWSDQNHLALSTAYGFASSAEHPGSITELAKLADQRMYEAKARYYHLSGNDRRRYGQLSKN